MVSNKINVGLPGGLSTLPEVGSEVKKMAKQKSQYVCQSCGRVTPAYMGKCPKCGEFGTMQEEVLAVETAVASKNPRAQRQTASQPTRLAEVTADGFERLSLPLAEFARVLGGGIVPGSLILVGGDPGIGKSTLLLDVAALTANLHGPVLYISGEESARQIKMRADRLGVQAKDLFLVTETNLTVMLNHIDEVKPVMVIIDSIQTAYVEDKTSSPGSVSQVRECAGRVQVFGKKNRHHHCFGGPCDQGRGHRRAACAGTYR